MNKIILFFIIFLIFIPFTIGNSGCWQFKDDYKVLLWSVPISPYENEEAQFILNLVRNEELMKDLDYANVWIDKGGEIIKRFDNLSVKDGLVEFTHKFDEARFYEIYVEFKSKTSSESIKLDFPYEVKEIKENDYLKIVVIFIFGLFLGLLLRKKIFNKIYKAY